MTDRVARVLVEGTIDKEFDYVVPASMAPDVRVGTMVRVQLGSRRVGGWVVDADVEPPEGVDLKPIAKVTGWGPDEATIGLARWAARRWAGRVAQLLTTASPPKAVRDLTVAEPGHRVAAAPGPAVEAAFEGGVGVLRQAPAEDRYPVVAAAAARGNALVVAPSISEAKHLAARLRRAGARVAVVPEQWGQARSGATVVGARAAAWAPIAEPAAFVLLDEHDEVHQEERVPTWHARDVLVERARRAGVPCVLHSPIPSLEARALGAVTAPNVAVERRGWPIVDVADRRDEDPRKAGLFSPALVRALQSDRRVWCVLNRKGRSQLLACDRCGAIATCETCDGSVTQPDDDYVCRRCDASRPAVCQACGAVANRNIRAGVTRAGEELTALVREPVEEVGAGDDAPTSRVAIGTEAILHHRADVDLVAFLDFDQELLAPRYRAAEQAMTLLVRAGRLVGGRSDGGRVLVQTRQPDHEVVRAAVLADPERLVEPEADRREVLGFPPFRAVADVSGAGADAFIDAVGHPLGIEVHGPRDGHWLLRAADHDSLADVLATTPRPKGRLRIEVGPLRV